MGAARPLNVIAFDLLQLVAALAESDGAFGSPEQEEAFASLLGELEGKVDAYGHALDQLEATEAIHRKRAAYHEGRARAAKNATLRIREHLRGAMEAMGQTKIAGEDYTATIQLGPPAVVIDVDPGALPHQFREAEIVYRPLRDRLREAIQAGNEIPGVSVKRASVLRIR